MVKIVYMARRPRVAPGGLVYHVFNRTVGKMKMFRRPKDFQAFESLLLQAQQRCPLRLLAWCIMGTHWHFVAWPKEDGELTEFFRWLTLTHAVRWRVSHHTVGYGHLYQGRFKSFPVQSDGHLLNVCRYVERNALTAGLVDHAERWRWSSLWARENAAAELQAILCDWPVGRPADWAERVNAPISDNELSRLRTCLNRGRPLGDDAWTDRTIRRLDLQHTVRPRGRPKKHISEEK
jgi:putative transposase